MGSRTWKNDLILGLFFFTTFVFLTSEVVHSESWTMTYGGKYDDGVRYFQKTSDGGFILPGWTYYSKSKYDAWIIKLDPRGDIEWQRAYGMDGFAGLISIQETLGGGYIGAGWIYPDPSNLDDRDMWILKVDSNGHIEWQNRYGGSNSEEGRSILQTVDGGYIVAGYTYTFGLMGVWVLKLDSLGNVQWQKTFGGSGIEIRSILQTPDEGYVLTAFTDSSGAGGYDAWVLKLDKNGNSEWQKTYGGNQGDFGEAIYRTSTGEYILAGSTESFGAGDADGWVLKLDANGNIQWQKAYGGANGDWLIAIRQTSDGGYLAAGQTSSFGAGEGDGWVLKLDLNGNIEWEKTLGGKKYDRFVSIQETSDEFILVGETGSFGTGGDDIWVSKIQKDGNMGNCPAAGISAATITVTTVTPNMTAVTGQNSTISPQTTNASEKETKVIPKFLCGIPDLVGSWISLDQTCNPTPKGEKCKISGTLSIVNMGHRDAESCSVKFYLSDDGNYDEGVDTFLKTISTGKIKVGASKAKKLSATLLGVTVSGKRIVAVIDGDHSVVEEDETNNEIPSGPIP